MKLRTFIPEISTHFPGMAPLRTARVRVLTASVPVSEVSTPAYTYRILPLLRLVSVVEKN